MGRVPNFAPDFGVLVMARRFRLHFRAYKKGLQMDRMTHRPIYLLFTRPNGSSYVEQRVTWQETGLPDFVETLRESNKKDGVIVALIERAEYESRRFEGRK